MAEKKIVTHYNPDLDAAASIWLIVRWVPGWERCEFAVVPAGETYQGEQVDSNPDVLHVDTGLGKLDHHQTEEYTCAAKLTLGYVKSQTPNQIKLGSGHGSKVKSTIKNSKVGRRQISDSEQNRKERLEWNYEALERLVNVVNQVDHFQEVYLPDPEADLYQFTVESILDGWKLIYREQDQLVIDKGLEVLDAVYICLVSKIEAEDILNREGLAFPTRWGEGIAVETKNNEVVSLAQKRGSKLAVLKHPTTGHVKIKAQPPRYVQGSRLKAQGEEQIDLTSIYQELKKKDPQATWFLHSSKTMVLNGSAKNPKMKATKLSLSEVVEIIKNID